MSAQSGTDNIIRIMYSKFEKSDSSLICRQDNVSFKYTHQTLRSNSETRDKIAEKVTQCQSMSHIAQKTITHTQNICITDLYIPYIVYFFLLIFFFIYLHTWSTLQTKWLIIICIFSLIVTVGEHINQYKKIINKKTIRERNKMTCARGSSFGCLAYLISCTTFGTPMKQTIGTRFGGGHSRFCVCESNERPNTFDGKERARMNWTGISGFVTNLMLIKKK